MTSSWTPPPACHQGATKSPVWLRPRTATNFTRRSLPSSRGASPRSDRAGRVVPTTIGVSPAFLSSLVRPVGALSWQSKLAIYGGLPGRLRRITKTRTPAQGHGDGRERPAGRVRSALQCGRRASRSLTTPDLRWPRCPMGQPRESKGMIVPDQRSRLASYRRTVAVQVQRFVQRRTPEAREGAALLTGLSRRYGRDESDSSGPRQSTRADA
jgi:hypothetical protein